MYRRSNLLEKLCLNPLVAWQRFIVRETNVRRYSARPMQRLQVFRPVLFPVANEHDPKPLQYPRQSTISLDNASQIRKSSHAAFQYNIHFVFSVRKRIEFLDPFVGQKLVQYWLSVCQKKSWIAWDIEVVWDHAHLLLGIAPGETPEDAALALLNNAEHWFHER